MSLCSAIGKNSNPIFIARVTSVDEGYIYFEVQQIFIGGVPRHVRIARADPKSVDGFEFFLGKTYLISAAEVHGNLVPEICGGVGTSELKDADPDDLAFLRGLSDLPERAWIQGTVFYAMRTAPEKSGPLAGIPIRIEGPSGTLTALTNQAGKYKVSGLEPGQYKVIADLPPGFEPSSGWKNLDTIQVPNSGCSESWLRVDAAQAPGIKVTGTLLGGGDRDWIEDVPITLQSANSEPGTIDWVQFGANTDHEGQFVFENVPAGKYILGANVGEPPTDTNPYRTTYYPAAGTKQSATIIEVNHNNLSDVNIQMPDPVHEERVRFVIQRKTLQPPAKVYVEFVDFKGKVVTDPDELPDGSDALDLISGYRYSAHAVGTDSKGHHICAEPVEFTAEKGTVIRLQLSRRDLDCEVESYVVNTQ